MPSCWLEPGRSRPGPGSGRIARHRIHPDRRRPDQGKTACRLAVLRPRRAQLYLHERRQGAARQLAGLGREPVFIRTHNLLTSGDGTPALKWGSTGAYSEDAEGRPLRLDDRRPDLRHLQRARAPALRPDRLHAPGPLDPARALPASLDAGRRGRVSTGWAYPPKDYAQVGRAGLPVGRALRGALRPGRGRAWYWEVWNEPNIFYWRGTPEEYHQALRPCRRRREARLAHRPGGRAGGRRHAGRPRPPGSSATSSSTACAARTTPRARSARRSTSSPSTPRDRRGSSTGHVQTGIGYPAPGHRPGVRGRRQFPELKGRPIVIGESDPDGCAACPATVFPQNGYRNGTLYASYTAAAYARTLALAERHGVNFEGPLTWAFEFEDQPYFAGFRVLSTNGIALPVLNVFRMLGLMGGAAWPWRARPTAAWKPSGCTACARRPDMRPGRPGGPLPERPGLALPRRRPAGRRRRGRAGASPLPVEGTAACWWSTTGSTTTTATRSRHGKPWALPSSQPPDQLTALERSAQLKLLTSPGGAGPSRRAHAEFPLPRQAVSLVTLRW